MIPRTLPTLTALNQEFWAGGGALRILRCGECGVYLHPPVPRCRSCRSTAVGAEIVSGEGVVYSFTVNHYRWNDAVDEPYVVAIVELAEQDGLRLTSNIVGCSADEVFIGMRVAVDFEDNGAIQVPVFRSCATQ